MLLTTGCSTPRREGQVVVALTIDWEGVELSPEGLDAIDWLRKRVPGPVTHFVSAAYFTKEEPEPIVSTLVEMVHAGDELGVHLHVWKSLAKASGVEPKLSPSFLTGSDAVIDYYGDSGYETDPDVYSVAELRALLQTSRRLLAQSKLSVSNSFRAGGFLATPKVIAAIRSEGFTIDSSALDHRTLDENDDDVMGERVRELWPHIDPASQPYLLDTSRSAPLEIPISAFADYVTLDEIAAILESAQARLAKAPDRDVFVVIGFNLETAPGLVGNISGAFERVRGNYVFVTIRHAAELARIALPPS